MISSVQVCRSVDGSGHNIVESIILPSLPQEVIKMQSKNNQGYLQFLNDIYEVSNACSTKTYIWGGMAIDILKGDLTREHNDLDGFTLNMLEKLNDLSARYENLGYETSFLEEFHMLKIKKGGLHAAFNRLDIDGDVAMWRHIGEQGTVYFPFSWLECIPRNFYHTQTYCSGINFEYGFRKIARLLNPEWKGREKDIIALEYLEERLSNDGIETKSVLKSIWSYNPFWAKKGYNPFDKPTLVWPNYLDS